MVAHCQLAYAEPALLTVVDMGDDYRRHPGVEGQQRDGLYALLCILYSRLVDQTSLVISVRGLLRQKMERNLDFYSQAIFDEVHDCPVGFSSVTSNVVETHSVTLRQDVSSFVTHLDGHLGY